MLLAVARSICYTFSFDSFNDFDLIQRQLSFLKTIGEWGCQVEEHSLFRMAFELL